MSMPAKTASAVSIVCPVLDTGSPACLSRRASWTLWDKLGVSVVAFSGSSLNSAAMSRSTSGN